ncbi:hypothetical protein SAMN02799630_04791 [Paenibacillus sp. UNCCL117]|uniref:hypothetical protein n=1 Tax=unclassified Paenibacillus TaxID=185978 RepID=UPI0008806F66|nr:MULTISPECIES: hypothetical protein [unclassified Paenibacillus]SDE14343.1 hypothetical protein SAMN04488602_1208 [Paenibacillus sp. cl123]SFW60570.1 hypothetical protein SAMN02799630_04791 [Paenibacillus sp. UNCCL117]
MNKPWKSGVTALVVGAMMLQGGAGALAADAGAGEADASASVLAASSATVPAAAPANYGLTADIRAAVKSVSVETTAQGLQLAATVRLYNGGAVSNRVPEHELRLYGQDGIAYVLKPSAANKKALQPKEIGELVYMATIDSKDTFRAARLSWVKVNEYVYPKQETLLLDMPVGHVWYGSGQQALSALPELAWGETFTIPGVNSGLRYTPSQYAIQSTEQGQVANVTLLADNPGTGRETVPAFRLDAAAEQKAYRGEAAEKEPVVLEAGGQAYLHYAIPLETGAAVTGLTVVTTEAFVPQPGAPSVAVDTGKLTVSLPADRGGQPVPVAYTLGSPIAFDPVSKLIDGQTSVSLMELHVSENPDMGYQTAVAKFRLTNNGTVPVTLPSFGAELVGSGGAAYAGMRQANAPAMLNPGLSSIVNYSFSVPKSEQAEAFTLKLLDTRAAAPYKTTVASLRTPLEKDGDSMSDETVYKVYPFDIRFNLYQISALFNSATFTYTYKVMLDLDITQADDVVVDDSSSKLRFEAVDAAGRTLDAIEAPFAGTNRLISGRQSLTFNNIKSEQLDSNVTIRVYESVALPNGATAKRLLKTLK